MFCKLDGELESASGGSLKAQSAGKHVHCTTDV